MLAFTPGTGFLVVWAIFLLVVAVIVIPFVLVLMLRLVMACVRLNTHADVADKAAVPVRANTDPVPRLAETLQLIRQVLAVARTVERHGAELETVLKRGGGR